jgi:hypothetical protein
LLVGGSRLEIIVIEAADHWAPWQWQCGHRSDDGALVVDRDNSIFWITPKNLDQEFGSPPRKSRCEAPLDHRGALDHIENVTMRRDVSLQVVHG